MKRVALYVRVSTQEQKQHGISVDSQIDALKQFSADNGYQIVDIYNDAGISARKSYKRRPALQKMIADCQAKRIDLVLFTKLDRFFRSVPDYYACIEQMNNVPWRAIWEDYETETSSGVFKVNIMLSVAQSEADRASERVKAVNEYRRAQGQYTSGKAPTGYKIIKSQLSKDPATKDGVEAFFSTYLSTFSIRPSMLKARELGAMFARDTALRMLKNHAYTGESFGATFEPYITQDQYDTIQRSISGRKVRRPATGNVYLFSGGLLRCAYCGSNMIASFRRLKIAKGGKKNYNFYRCSRNRNMTGCDSSISVSELKVEKALVNTIDAEMNKYIVKASALPVVDNTAKIAALKSKLLRIGDRYEEGDITKDEYHAKKDKINLEIAQLQAEPIREVEALPSDWRDIYDSLDQEHRRAFWYNTVTRITYDNEKGLRIYFD